jgi:hypothetical protein
LNRKVLWSLLAFWSLAVAVALAYLYFQPSPLDESDRATLVIAADLGFPASPGNENFEKRRIIGAIRVIYRARSLGPNKNATITEFTISYSNPASALLGFEAMKIGGTGGFALAAGKNEAIVPQDVHFEWADNSYWGEYRVRDAPAGIFLLVRVGNTAHFLSINGLTIKSESAFESMLRQRWRNPR